MKRLIKNILLRLGAILYRDNIAKVVFYHDIGLAHTEMGTEAKIFMEHMKILSSRGSRRSRGGAEDIVCFDDGFRGAYEHRDLLPRGTKIFIAPRLVGQPGYMTWDEIRELNRDYGVDFQCHTWSHQTLVGPMIDESPIEERTEEWYERELVESKNKIAAELGKDVDELCFPAGHFSDELIERCKKAEYKKVYASYPGNVTEDYIQPRCICQDLDAVSFKYVLNGGMNIFKSRYLKQHKFV